MTEEIPFVLAVFFFRLNLFTPLRGRVRPHQASKVSYLLLVLVLVLVVVVVVGPGQIF